MNENSPGNQGALVSADKIRLQPGLPAARLQPRISQLKDQIADRTKKFPDVFAADMDEACPRQLCQIEPEHRQDVNINFQGSFSNG